MAETILTTDEVTVLRAVLAKLTVRSRTGELGIMHGAERFVSTHLCLNKAERKTLAAIASKVGLQRGIAETS